MNDVLVSTDGQVGRLRLNRPRAIHALNHAMCRDMLAAIEAWRGDEGVHLVLIDHATAADGDPKLSRGFCAGGDIRAIWESGREDGAAARAFFHEEYRLNHRLFTYAKPIVAFMDGIVMGGGVGISQPARYRIATERTVFAMPETGIGLFPDVGGGWYLSRLPDRIGQYVALTGARLNGAECLALGLATHVVPSAALDGVKAALIDRPADVEAILVEAADADAGDAPILAHRETIARTFASDSYEEVLAALAAEGTDWARAQLETLAAKSPQACKVSLRLLAQGAEQTDFAGEMAVEYRVASHVCQRHDFIEGVRALIVDKDNAPKWQPASAEEVSDHVIDQIFAPLDPAEEWTPLR